MVEIQQPDFGLTKFLEDIVAQGHNVSVRKPVDVSEGADRWALIEVNYQPKTVVVKNTFIERAERDGITFPPSGPIGMPREFTHQETLSYAIAIFDSNVIGVKRVEGKNYGRGSMDNISVTSFLDVGAFNYRFSEGITKSVVDIDINFASIGGQNKDITFEDFATVNTYTLAEVGIGYQVEGFHYPERIRWGSFVAQLMFFKYNGTNFSISVKDRLLATTDNPNNPTYFKVDNRLPFKNNGYTYDLMTIVDDGVLIATKESDTERTEIRFSPRIETDDFSRLEQALHTDTRWLYLPKMPLNRPILSYSKSLKAPGK